MRTLLNSALIYTIFSVIFGNLVNSKFSYMEFNWLFYKIEFKAQFLNYLYYILIVILGLCFLIYSAFFNFLFIET